jgi:glucose/arabinose dehydrogenase
VIRRPATAALGTALAATLALPLGGSPASTAPAAEPVPKVSATLARDLAAPWGVAVLPSGAALVAERNTGRIKRVNGKGGVSTAGRVPGVLAMGEGGLMGLAVASDFAEKRHVYAYFTGVLDNRIVRMTYGTDGKLGKPTVVLKGIPKGFVHNGGRLAFGPDGMLYAGTGETGVDGLSQKPKSLAGKILRLTRTGEVPADNPTKGSYVYSLGHRNVQGLAFDAKGRLFAAEFGQNTWDELNLIRPGRNYGWPLVEGKAGDKRFVDPVTQWSPANASPSGIAFAKGSIWVAGLRGQRLWRVTLGADNSAGLPKVTRKAYFEGTYGRLRTVVTARDGTLWLVTNNTDGRGDPGPDDDRILRLKLS